MLTVSTLNLENDTVKRFGVLNILIADISADRRHEVEQACENCPTQALCIED